MSRDRKLQQKIAGILCEAFDRNDPFIIDRTKEMIYCNDIAISYEEATPSRDTALGQPQGKSRLIGFTNEEAKILMVFIEQSSNDMEYLRSALDPHSMNRDEGRVEGIIQHINEKFQQMGSKATITQTGNKRGTVGSMMGDTRPTAVFELKCEEVDPIQSMMGEGEDCDTDTDDNFDDDTISEDNVNTDVRSDTDSIHVNGQSWNYENDLMLDINSIKMILALADNNWKTSIRNLDSVVDDGLNVKALGYKIMTAFDKKGVPLRIYLRKSDIIIAPIISQ